MPGLALSRALPFIEPAPGGGGNEDMIELEDGSGQIELEDGSGSIALES